MESQLEIKVQAEAAVEAQRCLHRHTRHNTGSDEWTCLDCGFEGEGQKTEGVWGNTGTATGYIPPAEAEDEGARLLERLWGDYDDALLALESASSGFIELRVREVGEARAAVEAAIRREATAPFDPDEIIHLSKRASAASARVTMLESALDGLGAEFNRVVADFIEEHTRAERAEAALREALF